jgi:dipeptidyl aminopeptidase/acylaminoacyl peptidase
MKKPVYSFLFLLTFLCFHAVAQLPGGYMLPPQEIIDLVDAPSTPSMSISPDNSVILLTDSPELPSIEEMAMEEYRLGGIRFDPVTNGPSRTGYGSGFTLMDIDGTNSRPVQGLPANPRISNTRWSPDGSKIAFTHTTATGIELWVVDVAQARARRLTAPIINDIMGTTFTWLSDNHTIIFSAIPENRGAAPGRPRVAAGPVVQQSIGRRAAVRTFQDLLSDRYDEAIFDYYTTVQITRIDMDGNTSKLGEPGVIRSISDSPDGNYLMVTRLVKPYSYIVPASRFPHVIELMDIEGNLVRVLAEVPLTDDLPQGFGAVRTGPRSHTWRADAPATLYWVEALDGGDPAVEAEYREQLFSLSAPFTGDPLPGFKLGLRYGGISWGKNDFALVSESWRATRLGRLHVFNPEKPQEEPKLLVERSMEDRYNDPGSFQFTTNEYGRGVLQFDRRGRKLYLVGQGASAEGDRPFVDEYDIRNGQTTRLWRSEPPYFERPVRLIDAERQLVITRRESNDVHPNYFLRDMRRNRLTQITQLPDPFPQLRELHKEMVHYEREDGIPLSGTLYLPAGYRPGVDAPLPTLLWAYPREFKSADAAGQVSGSPHTYTRVGASSIVMLVTQGYAVLDNASFPIVGEGDDEPNDTFVEQLVANARGAIDKLVEMGVTDPERVGVSGHSYGAFMTANLLSHSDLFAAGVARSGAYNRTLTPFGFQAEERTYWQAPEVYFTMSPFSFANRVTTPILLIHGIDDNNSGTFPIQSERYYDALRGHGATVRLVMLPHESHGYRARESVLHMHWEWLEWFNRYVKNKGR